MLYLQQGTRERTHHHGPPPLLGYVCQISPALRAGGLRLRGLRLHHPPHRGCGPSPPRLASRGRAKLVHGWASPFHVVCGHEKLRGGIASGPSVLENACELLVRPNLFHPLLFLRLLPPSHLSLDPSLLSREKFEGLEEEQGVATALAPA